MPDWLIPLLTLTLLEVILGVDNVIFIAILVSKLPVEQQDRARKLGLGIALGARILLLLFITWMMAATEPLFMLTDLGFPESWFLDEQGKLSIETAGISAKDIILLIGGMFLIGKSTYEIHEKLEGPAHGSEVKVRSSFNMVILQIVAIDIIFSLDSVITAVGMVPKGEMVKQLAIMITAIVIAMAVMFAFSGPISRFVYRHPTMKMLALSFLILIGVMLVVEGTGHHFNRGYIYFAMAFSFVVELMNMKLRAHPAAVELREPPPVSTK